MTDSYYNVDSRLSSVDKYIRKPALIDVANVLQYWDLCEVPFL